MAMSLRGADRPTPAEAKAFIDQAESKLLALSNENQRASWVQSTYITVDTEFMRLAEPPDALTPGPSCPIDTEEA